MLRPSITPENTIVGSFITMNPRANLRKIFGEQREVKKTYYLILEENSSQCENFNFRNKPSKHTLTRTKHQHFNIKKVRK